MTKRIKTNVATLNAVLVEDSCFVTLFLCGWIDWMGVEGGSQGSKPKRSERFGSQHLLMYLNAAHIF